MVIVQNEGLSDTHATRNPDGDVDLDDYACFFACALGPGQGLLPDCEPFDVDDDMDIVDYSNFETQFKGPS